jgi:hypothetical protein
MFYNRDGNTPRNVQDKWNVTSRLTVNVGLRYEFGPISPKRTTTCLVSILPTAIVTGVE